MKTIYVLIEQTDRDSLDQGGTIRCYASNRSSMKTNFLGVEEFVDNKSYLELLNKYNELEKKQAGGTDLQSLANNGLKAYRNAMCR